MIDLHCHFLPGIDDGARNLEEALALAQAAVDNGIQRAVMTPHLHPGRWENFAQDIADGTQRFRRALADRGIALEIGFAAEVRLSPEIPMLIRQGRVPFLGQMDGYSMMLLEFPHGHIPLGADKLVAHLLQMKVRPVIAHPERNKDVMRDPRRLAPFLEMDCIMQLTAASVVGRFGERAQGAALALLESDATMILATDAHNLEARPPLLREGVAAAARVVGEERARDMADALPNRIAASQFDGEDVAAIPGVGALSPMLDSLLLRVIDERIQRPPGDSRSSDVAEVLARQYHRELLRALREDRCSPGVTPLLRDIHGK
ncbi:tyrosine-protein phosphatase [Parahaliea aestuarii]|uniref:tyrosine-protein phosphatase n=1 Tax=Parahaliea aestuarii TaxID=1852021 RepID=UPI00164EF63C|nr:CpsB/CapC family capsule biosynthesis tyrosine phosphatase [Parahaliea aestuarii]